MADIPSAASPTSPVSAQQTGAPSTSPSSGLTAVPVVVSGVSQALENLTHTIQTNATPVSLSDNNTLTLSTALGPLSISLPQLATIEHINLQQQLINLIDAQRPLTLSLQPGSPPTQAVLLIPAATTSVIQQNPSVTPLSPSQSISAPPSPLSPGITLTAIVLPSGNPLALQVPLTPSSQTYAPLSPPNLVPPPALTSSFEPEHSFIPIISTQNPVAPQVAQLAELISAAEPSTVLGPTSTTAPLAPPAAQQPLPLMQPSLSPSPASPTYAAASLQSLTTSHLENPSIQTSNLEDLSAILQTGNEVTLHIDGVQPPGTSTATLSSLAPGQVLATVTGAAPDGKLIIQAGDATLLVKTQTPVSVGTTLIITPQTIKTVLLSPLPAMGTQNFPSLPQIMTVLSQSNPQLLTQMLAALPQANSALASTLLLLFSVFKKGDASGWLGEQPANALLSAGRGDLIANLSREMGSASQSVHDSIVGEWRSYSIPLYAQNQFQSMTLYVHNDNQSPQKHGKERMEAANGKVRFLIDLRLSKLGAMQLDGFVQPKRLDMLLRSENMLPEGLHNHLRSAYINAVSAVGYTGSLNFQVGRQHWLVMQNDTPHRITT